MLKKVIDAAASRRTQNKQVFEILLKNPAIYDGAQLFGTAHKNLVKTGTGVTQEAMQTMIMALANQRDQFDQAIVINPRTIVVPSGLSFDMYTLFNSPYIETKDNTQAVNPLYNYRGMLEVVEDPTINTLCGGMGNIMPWFLFGNPSDCDGIEDPLPEWPGNPDDQKNGSSWTAWIYLGYLPRLGHHRNGLSLHRQEPRRQSQHQAGTCVEKGGHRT